MDRTRLTRRGFGALGASAALYAGFGRGADGAAARGGVDARYRPVPAGKSIGFYVGSDLTADGSTLLGGFGHEPSSHWLEIVPRQTHPQGATTTVGVTEDAGIPGELTEIPQARETNKYVASMYSEFAGFPPPLTNGGLNEHGVAARDIWSPSREELVELAEEATPQTGPQYSDLAKAAMERASSAREAVEVVGGLMDEHGYSTYGGNSHLFADEDEGWVFINFAHPDGDLWAAERLGSDEVRVSYFGYIREFPADHENDPDFAASDRLVDFAEEQGWWDGEGETLDLLEVYGVGEFPAEEPTEEYVFPEFYQDARHPHERERELEALAPVSLEDMLALVRDPRWATDFAGYGQVAHLRPETRPELQTLWTAVTTALTTPFVPIPVGAEKIPPEFRQHRYLTANASANFLDREWALQEATRYATRDFKRLLYFTCAHPERFYADVIGRIEGFERELLAERDALERAVCERLEAGDEQAARDRLSENVTRRLLDSLRLGTALARDVEAETRERVGIPEPEGRGETGETTPPTSQSMDEGPETTMVHGYVDDLHADYPRRHGAYTDEFEVDLEAPTSPAPRADTD